MRLLQAFLRAAGDPDWRGLDHFARGVRIGVGVRLPRTPAVFKRKRRWRLEGQGDALVWKSPSVETVWLSNYKSARDQADELERQLEECHSRGWALKLTQQELLERFPEGAAVSALGAVCKLDPSTGATTSVRMVLDGTHGTFINKNVRVRDQDSCLAAQDVRRLQRAQAHYGTAVGLAVDVKSAHRIPAVAPEDWRFQCCRSRDNGHVYTFRVGVFGISSIAYWWARLGGSLIRLTHYLADPGDELWILLMADDSKLESTGRAPGRSILWALWTWTVFGFPLSWAKTQGGSRAQWIGYDVWIKEHWFSVELTELTAPWAYYSAHSSTCGKNTEEAHSSQRTQVFTSSRSYSYSLGLLHDIGDGIHMETNFCEMFEARWSIRWTRAEGVRRSQWTGFNLARQKLSYSLGSRQWTDIDLVRLSPSKYLGFSSLRCVV